MRQPVQNSRHRQLLREGVERIEVSYLKAREGGAEVPTVLVIDGFDEVGLEILKESGRGDEIDAHLEKAIRRWRNLYFTWGLPREVAAGLMARWVDDRGQAILSYETVSGYLAIIVAEGSYSLVGTPPVDA